MKTLYEEAFEQAKKEIRDEEFREKVEDFKRRYREKLSIWQWMFPYRLRIVKLTNKKGKIKW